MASAATLAHGTYVDPMAGRQTFVSFADEWAVAQDWKATSRESWPYIRARLAPLLGDLPLASIDRLVLQRVRQALSTKYARSTTTVTMTYAGMIMRAATRAGASVATRRMGFALHGRALMSLTVGSVRTKCRLAPRP